MIYGFNGNFFYNIIRYLISNNSTTVDFYFFYSFENID